ncbi:BNA4 [Symbiodinium pilosum]|uniref:BNA4 protein n=1 Tax=Symbiodinium pilosum TaxID=2952 RepID=A0A812XL53_SYMPI|nr:BNA4 [Symbiodinium pilosum]
MGDQGDHEGSPRGDKPPAPKPSRHEVFYQECVDDLWGKDEKRLENRAAETFMRERLFESLQLIQHCDDHLTGKEAAGAFLNATRLNTFIPILVVVLRAWRLFGCHEWLQKAQCGRGVRWALDTVFHCVVLSWYGFMAGLFSTMSLTPGSGDIFLQQMNIGPTVYIFLLTALSLTVLDRLQTLVASTVSFGFFAVPLFVALIRILEEKGQDRGYLLVLMEQLTLLIAIVALCLARWASWRDRMADFNTQERLKTGIIDEKVKRCQAEFTAERLTESSVPKEDGEESSYLYAAYPEVPAAPHRGAERIPPSALSAPPNMDRLGLLQSGAPRCDCLPMSAKVYADGSSGGKPASELTAGERILCYDHLAGNIKFVEVDDCTVVSGPCNWSRVAMSDGTQMSVTADHPVRVVGETQSEDSKGAWGLGGGRVVPAGELKPGNMLKILRLGAVPVQAMQIEADDQPRVRVNVHQSWRYSLFCSQGAGPEMTAVAVESSDGLDGRREEVQNTFIGGAMQPPDVLVVRKPHSAPGGVAGAPHTDVEKPALPVPEGEGVEDVETQAGDDSAIGDARGSSSSEDSPDLQHAKGCCQPCLFQSRYFSDPEKYPACSKADCLARNCHLPHSEEYIAKYKAMKSSLRVDVQDLQGYLEQIAVQTAVQGIQDVIVDTGDQAISEAPSTEGARTPKPDCFGQATLGVGQLFEEKHAERFEIQPNGVPVTKMAPKRHSMISSKSTISSYSLGEDEWGETFVLSEQEATDVYDSLYRDLEVLRLWRLIWDFLTIVLVGIDAVMLPLLLAWPAADGSGWDDYYKATPVFWVADICMMFLLAVLAPREGSRWGAIFHYVCTWFPLDALVVTLDLVLLAELVEGDFRALTMLRLLRTAKFRQAITAVESRLAASGFLRAVNLSTILQCVVFIFGVNHALACMTMYIGRLAQESGQMNWLHQYGMQDQPVPLQYMISFNWVIAQYTPAPYPFTAQNETEQALMLAIILTCLPMLGAQIGIISGTLNLMTEKAKERDHVKRDLQRWLRKTHVKGHLQRRVLTALDDVLGSQESPLEVKEPLALDFLPSTLIQELRVVKTGETLAGHPFFSLLMDAAWL